MFHHHQIERVSRICRKSAGTLLLVTCILSPFVVAIEESFADAPPRFENDVVPIFQQYCVRCHGGKSPKNGLSLEDIQSVVDGGISGTVLVPGKSDQSYLYHLVQRGEMPPQKDQQLSPEEVDVIRRWIDGGLIADAEFEIPHRQDNVTQSDREHWAFQPLRKPDFHVGPASAEHGPTLRTAIDHFVHTKLGTNGLGMAAPAEKSTLLRRLYLDVIGLPPTVAQLDDFLANDRPDAYEQVVDQLLASPQFGPRWGRHWLDLAGYADTVGFDHVPTHIIVAEGKWRYRDYVINAFNRDLSYVIFIQEQLAGDELVEWKTAEDYTPQIIQNLVATGFLRTARDQTHEDVGVITPNFYEVLYDTTEIMISSLLGITLKCARCHDHKFDAFTQTDYYRIQACLMPAYNPTAWRAVFPYPKNGKAVPDRSLPDASEKHRHEITKHNKKVHSQITHKEKKKDAIINTVRQRLFQKKLQAIPEQIRADLAQALATEKEQRNEVQANMVETSGPAVKVKQAEIDQSFTGQETQTISEIDQSISELREQLRAWGKIQALYDYGDPPTAFVLQRGQFEYPGQPVEPGFLSVLCDSPAEAIMTVPQTINGSSGYRLGFSRWLTKPESRASALLARVMVNRCWQHLFGRGIVETSGDFGVQGTQPTHPDLLEWMSLEFQRIDWRIKPLLRTILVSRVYRQSTHVADNLARQGNANDPNNELYWHMPLRRLESETVRDSLLAISNRINLALDGPPVRTRTESDGRILVDPDQLNHPADTWKRSVYLLTRRGYHHTLLDVFDQPLIETTCNARQFNAVALQSLTMINDQFVYDQAHQLAKNIVASGIDDPGLQTALLYRTILSRLPDDTERTWCIKSLEQLKKEHNLDALISLTEVCHTLLNTSEFLYRE